LTAVLPHPPLESGQGGAAIVPGVVSGQFQFGFSDVASLPIAQSRALPPLGVVLPLGFRVLEHRVLAWYHGLRRAQLGASWKDRGAMSKTLEVRGLRAAAPGG
jgi:hypothetical protein